MSDTVPPARDPLQPLCSRFAWCNNPHPPADRADRDHVGIFGDLSGSGFTLEVIARQSERGGQLVDQPAIRILYGPDALTESAGGPGLPWLNLAREQAGDLAEILAMLPWPGAGELPAVLAAAARALAVPPCPAWCESSHAGDGVDRVHQAVAGPFPGPAQPRIVYTLVDRVGKRFPVRVDLRYVVDGREVVRDMEQGQADDWADILGGLDAAALAAFPAALRQVAERLDAIEHAPEVLREQRSCLFEWCVADHNDPEWAHSHISEPVRVPGLSAVRLLVEPEEVGLVQINFTGNSHEVSPIEALDLADILESVGNDEISAMAGAIRTLASLAPTGLAEPTGVDE